MIQERRQSLAIFFFLHQGFLACSWKNQEGSPETGETENSTFQKQAIVSLTFISENTESGGVLFHSTKLENQLENQ